MFINSMTNLPATSATDEFYKRFFTEDTYWSSRFPNPNEALRLGKIVDYLSQIVQFQPYKDGHRLRILDVGCGRGWLTHLASVYGQCDGIDPVADVIAVARQHFPNLKFRAGVLNDVIQSPDFEPYDVVIASEVIEHVVDKQDFVAGISQCLAPNGYAILTTPRGEEYRKWLRLGYQQQPIETWLSERQLLSLFHTHQFQPISHDRVYLDLPYMSVLHFICASPRVKRFMEGLGLTWLRAGLLYQAGFYQVWWFRKLA
jgi:2-polyprenyl-3-methyl-5-hydroxy-6-metoxy-1,4-benzoquinol methylase